MSAFLPVLSRWPLLAIAVLVGDDARSQSFVWAHGYDEPDMHVQRTATDASGNIYVAGFFGGHADMDPGPDTHEFAGNGNFDGYVTKFAPDGTFLWCAQLGGPADDRIADMTIDADGNILVTGNFRSTVDFDPGPGTMALTAAGTMEAFVCKFTPAGELAWARATSGPSFDTGSSIATDGNGDVFVSGFFHGDADMDPGPGIAQLHTTRGDGEQFIWKLGAAGEYRWAGALTSSNAQEIKDLAIAANGDLLVLGQFNIGVDLDPGPGTAEVSTPDPAYNVYLARYNTSGNYLWSAQITALHACSVVVDDEGNILVCGSLSGTADFDPSAAVANVTAPGPSGSVFVWKLDPNGAYLWAKGIGGTDPAQNWVNGMAVDGNGRVILTGGYDTAFDADQGTGVDLLPEPGSFRTDLFIDVLDADGDHLWAGATGAEGDDLGRAVATDAQGNIIVAGTVQGVVDFDPGPSVVPYNALTVIGDYSTMLLKLGSIPAGIATPDLPLAAIFPNPAEDRLYITSEHPLDEALLLDANGRIVLRSLLKGTATTLDLSSIAPGIYCLRLMTAEGPLSRSIIKQ